MKSHALLSPLEGVSDVGFRELFYKLGAGFTWTEMIRADALGRKNQATLDLIDTYDSITPTGLQLLAKSPESLRKALVTFQQLSQSDCYSHFRNISAIDLNFGTFLTWIPSVQMIDENKRLSFTANYS